MENEEKERLTRVEANVANMADNVVEIKDWLKVSASNRMANHSEIIQRLTKIETKQDIFTGYQQECDSDRKTLHSLVSTMEKYNSHSSGKMSIINALVTWIGSIIIAIGVLIMGEHKL
jgi:hypothetical protein